MSSRGARIAGGGPRSSLGLIALAITLVALAISAAPASAATTRAEWVAQVDPICQNGLTQESVAAQPLLAALGQEKRHRHSLKFKRRANRALRAFYRQQATIEQSVNAQIATIPPAPDDVSLVGVWLRARGELSTLEVQLFAGGNNPKKGLKGIGQALTSVFRLIALEQEVSDLVRDFGFQYCNAPDDLGAIVNPRALSAVRV